MDIQALSEDIKVEGLPAGADPFNYISHVTTHRFTPRLPQSAIILLAIFLVFYILIAAFNLVILLLSYIGKSKRPLWLFKKVYIHARSGEKLYSTPLYLINTGLLMSVSQLLSSATSQAYIWMQVRMHVSEQYSLHCLFFTALGLLTIFDTYTYWGMAHCFLALYYSNKSFAGKSKRLSWLRSPLSINIFFLTCPICVTIAVAIVVGRLSVVYHELQMRTKSLRATLSHGSLIWKQLELPSHSEDEKKHLSSQLAHVQTQIDTLLHQINTLLPELLARFTSARTVMLFLIPATSLVFVLSFWKLAQKYKTKGNGTSDPTIKIEFSDSWQTNSNPRPVVSPNRTLFQTLRSDPQFLRLTIRAFSTLLGILAAMTFWLLAVFKLSDMIVDPVWHGVASWLPTLSSTWTAAPVAWQSWRLYIDQKPQTFDHSNKLEEIPLPKKFSRTALPQFLPDT